MTREIRCKPLTMKDFEDFGDVLEFTDEPDKIINQGMCGRYHDLANMSFDGGRAGLSLFDATPRALPLTLEMMERHPDGSQAFLPMTAHPFLVVVAPDVAGAPGEVQAFVTKPGQGINYHRGTWHGVLMPLHAPGHFAVVDRIGPGANLQEHWFRTSWTILP